MKRSHEAIAVISHPEAPDDALSSIEHEETQVEWKDDDYLALDSDHNNRRATPPPDEDCINNQKPNSGDHDHGDNDDDASAGYDSMEENAMEESSSSVSEYTSSTPPWLLLQNPLYDPNPRHQPHHHRSHQHYHHHHHHSLVALHNEIMQFVQLMEPLDTEREARKQLIQELQSAVREEFGPTAQLLVLGSQATGLFLPTSDIDLTLYYNDNDNNEPSNNSSNSTSSINHNHHNNDDPSVTDSTNPQYNPLHKKPIHRFSDLMAKKWKNRLSYLETIEATRVPICKMRFADSDIAVDVSFNQPNGVMAAELMTEYLVNMPPLRHLTIVLKYFLSARDLNEPYSGGVGSYLLQLLIVSFLQHRERMAYHRNEGLDYNLGSLLLDFFELYGLDFNYLVTGLSVRFDGFYYRKSNSSRPNCICVENPLEITHDVGSSSYRFIMVQRSFAIAYRTLVAMITPGPRPTNVPTNSILGSILPTSHYMTSRLVVKRRDRALSAPRHAVARGRPSSSVSLSAPDGALVGVPPRNGAVPPRNSNGTHGGALSSPRYGRKQENNNNNKKRKT